MKFQLDSLNAVYKKSHLQTLYYRKDDLEDLLKTIKNAKGDKVKQKQREGLLEELLKLESEIDELEALYGKELRKVRKVSQMEFVQEVTSEKANSED